jgi:hypothetical protein
MPGTNPGYTNIWRLVVCVQVWLAFRFSQRVTDIRFEKPNVAYPNRYKALLGLLAYYKQRILTLKINNWIVMI